MTDQEIRELLNICIDSLKKNKNLELSLMNRLELEEGWEWPIYVINYIYKTKKGYYKEEPIKAYLTPGEMDNIVTEEEKIEFGKVIIKELYDRTKDIREQS